MNMERAPTLVLLGATLLIGIGAWGKFGVWAGLLAVGCVWLVAWVADVVDGR